MKNLYLISLAILLPIQSISQARITREWTYDDLQKESDLVVIAEVAETKTVALTDDLVQNGLSGFASFKQVETTFRVHAVLKGKVEQKQITLVHFRIDWEKTTSITDGPLLVAFPTKEQAATKEREKSLVGPDYLLFLKSRKDGKFDPVSGQVDPIWSARPLGNPMQLFKPILPEPLKKEINGSEQR
jgi:hypothetical protein